ncbi:MAG: IS4 family transposase [Caldilineaceae bacterium]
MSSLDTVRARFARNEGLPFLDILTESRIREVLNEHGVQYRDRVFSPVATIWGFLSQVLSEDRSCRDTVSRIIAHRVANGMATCSPSTASYCNARSRIHTSVLSTLAKRTAEELQMSIGDQWEWNGRAVFIVDGSYVSMPDTAENQAVYPQPPNQKPGIGFPLARITVVLSLATGACHELAIAPYKGKGTGEKTLFRQMYDTFNAGDVVLADALFDDYFVACDLCNRGIDLVARAKQDRVGTRIAESRSDGDLVVWQRPNKPPRMTRKEYRNYPKHLVMREVPVDARDKNNRVTQFTVITTILARSIGGKQIGDLYERRWEGELDLRSIKATMQMDVLRCKTPDMVHKEIWTHLLAYNLLRTVMAVAANENDLEPRKVSFKGAKQALTAFAPKIEAARPEDRRVLIDAMLTTIAYHRVGDRPERWEPRARKRRSRKANRLMQPRHIAKLSQNRSRWF